MDKLKIVLLAIVPVLFSLTLVPHPSYAERVSETNVSNQPISLDEVTKILKINLPDVMILPDSPFYQVKTTIEEIQLFFASTDEQKLQLLLSFGQKRLAEALKLQDKNKPELAKQTLDTFDKTLKQAQEILSTLNLKQGLTQYQTHIELQEKEFSLIQFVTGEYNISWQRNND